MTIPDPRPLLEVELVVVFNDDHIDLGLMSQQNEVAQEHLRRNCAEVNIPVHTDDAIYVFVCFLGHLARHVPAIYEMTILKKKGDHLVASYGQYCKPMEVPS